MNEFVDKLCVLLIKNSSRVISQFKVAYFALFLLVGFILSTPYYSKVGNLFGEVSVLLYVASLIPGIFQRLAIPNQVVTVIRVYRRHIGISMYLFALSHMILKRFPTFTTDFLSLPPFEIVGIISLQIFLLLFITSNNLSQRVLGIWWVYLQRLTYLGMFFVFLHLSIHKLSTWGILMGLTIITELLSFFVSKYKLPSPTKQI